MALDYVGLAIFSFAIIISSIYSWKILNWVWFKPKQLEKFLRKQGFNGKPYRFLIGDYREIYMKTKEAQSKPISFSHDIAGRVAAFIAESAKNYGKNCLLWLGPKPTALISDQEMIKEVLSKSYVFQKSSTPLDKYLAQGLVAYEKEKWAKHRKLINPAFHVEKLKHMLPSFYLSCCDMLAEWDDIVAKEGSCELDIWPYLKTLTSDAISRTSFGSNYEEGKRIFELQNEQGGLVLKASELLYIPGWRFLPTKLNKKMKENVKEIESAIMKIIDKRMKLIEAGESNSDDLLGILLESNFREIQQNGNSHGMSLKEVMEECKLFYIAGEETTSSLLVWTMILLSKHPEWQTRAREEVLQVFGRSKPDVQELNQLKVITMIFHEVLRLYPPAVFLGRKVHQETTLGKVTLPADTDILLPVILLHHDRHIWGENVNEFSPERFSEGVLKATGGKFSYLPFGGGPRICIGQNFAMLEAKMALSLILQSYSFEISPSYSHAPETVLILQPQHGAQLILHKL